MIITFKNRKFQEECSNHRLLERGRGKDQAKRIRRRLDDLQAATVLEDMRSLPGRCHELRGDRAGQLSLDLDHPYRLIFEPIDASQIDDFTSEPNPAGATPTLSDNELDDDKSLPEPSPPDQSDRQNAKVPDALPFIKPDGGLDWKKVTAVLILGVEDTHE